MKDPHGIPPRYRKLFCKDHWEFMRNHSFDPATKMVTNPAHPEEPQHIDDLVAFGKQQQILLAQLDRCSPISEMPVAEGLTDGNLMEAENRGYAYSHETDEVYDSWTGFYFSPSLLPIFLADYA